MALLAACTPTAPTHPKTVEMVAMPPPVDTPPPPAPPVDPNAMPVAVGGIATIDAAKVKNFSVANANIDVRLTPDGKKFIIAGKTAGRCDLVLFFKDGTEKILKVTVTPAE